MGNQINMNETIIQLQKVNTNFHHIKSYIRGYTQYIRDAEIKEKFVETEEWIKQVESALIALNKSLGIK
jgi:hypothetical protein